VFSLRARKDPIRLSATRALITNWMYCTATQDHKVHIMSRLAALAGAQGLHGIATGHYPACTQVLTIGRKLIGKRRRAKSAMAVYLQMCRTYHGMYTRSIASSSQLLCLLSCIVHNCQGRLVLAQVNSRLGIGQGVAGQCVTANIHQVASKPAHHVSTPCANHELVGFHDMRGVPPDGKACTN
jgi:hypothetical protein